MNIIIGHARLCVGFMSESLCRVSGGPQTFCCLCLQASHRSATVRRWSQCRQLVTVLEAQAHLLPQQTSVVAIHLSAAANRSHWTLDAVRGQDACKACRREIEERKGMILIGLFMHTSRLPLICNTLRHTFISWDGPFLSKPNHLVMK